MRVFILSLVIGLTCRLAAQEQHFCGTTEMQNNWFAQHPEFKAQFEQLQQQAAEQDRIDYQNGYNKSNARTASTMSTASVYTVPVVFHILHTGGPENITDTQVQDAVSILTRDFNMRNTDTSDVVVQFKQLIGNPQIEFQLATRDPDGNCTNGIIRHWDLNTDWIYGFGNNGFAGYAYTWNPTRYLNIYVVKTMASGFAGYTYNPGSGIPTSADAVVILSTYIGSIGTGSPFTSRALTHEVGHWFNLAHTWGSTNNPGVACGDDGVTDTPITKGNTACNLTAASICNPPIVENMQNYMEYAYCQRMYTLGQTNRMVNCINASTNGRNNLSTATNLSVTGVTFPATGCIPQLQVGPVPAATICVGKPITLTSYSYNASPTSYAWTGNDAVIANPGNSSTSITFTSSGTKTVNCVVSNGNGSSNQTATVIVKSSVPDVSGSYMEGFESGIVPTNWTSISPTSPTEEWTISSDGASEGVNSALVTGETFAANAIAILESPSYDFKDNPGVVFSFKYAYAKYSTANKDKFKVQASKDCGGTWTDIYVPNNTNMASGSGGVTSTLYYPAPSEWKYYDGMTQLPVFNAFKNEQNVKLRFYFQEDVDGTGNGNRLYLDEINFSTPTGINELTKQVGFNVYPNPSTSTFNMSLNLSNASKVKYDVVSVTGAVLISVPETTVAEGPHEFSINENGRLSAGIYFVNLDLNGVKMSKKIVISE